MTPTRITGHGGTSIRENKGQSLHGIYIGNTITLEDILDYQM